MFAKLKTLGHFDKSGKIYSLSLLSFLKITFRVIGTESQYNTRPGFVTRSSEKKIPTLGRNNGRISNLQICQLRKFMFV